MSEKDQRVTTTEDNEDQGALNVVAQRLAIDDSKGGLTWERRAARILSALSEAGYTVVKTEWESAGMFTGMRRVVGPWEPVPESDTLGGGANG